MRRYSSLFFLALMLPLFLFFFITLVGAFQPVPSAAKLLHPPVAPRLQLNPLQGVTQLTVGRSHVCVVTNAGALKCWGNNDNGQLGDETATSRSSPVGVFGLSSGVVMAAAGSNHTCALLTTGGVKCWGANGLGQLGYGSDLTISYVPVDVKNLSSGVIQIVDGFTHNCAIAANGGVNCWGDNGGGALGDGTATRQFTPIPVTGLGSGVKALAGGGDHFCALLDTGGVKCWGKNDNGQVGIDKLSPRETPVNVTNLSSGVVAVTAGNSHSCALLSAGTVKCWGNNDSGQLGNNSTISSTRPVDVDLVNLSGRQVTTITAGYNHTCAIAGSDGAVFCWGNNSFGSLGNGTNQNSTKPVPVVGLTNNKIKAIGAGGDITCVVTTTGRVRCWGTNGLGELGIGRIDSLNLPTTVAELPANPRDIEAGALHTCAVLSNGAAKCWGSNFYGQLGDNTGLSRLSPVDVTGLSSGVNKLVSGGAFSCVLTDSGGVQCWGRNEFGQIGDETSGNIRLAPVHVKDLSSGVQVLAAGINHNCVLVSAVVKCWGRSREGQLGNGGTKDKTKPTDTAPLGDSKKANKANGIAAGQFHTCATLTITTTRNGGFLCWGGNSNGQLGNGTTGSPQTSPANNDTQIISPTETISGIVAGRAHTCAIFTGGVAKCWGNNSRGQLGDGTTTLDRSSPVDVIGLNATVTTLEAGNTHTCAITSNGAMKCWGSNRNGELGNGTNLDSAIPVDVSGLSSGVTAIAAGDDHTCAIVNGIAKCWGNNGAGQLGDGNGWRTIPADDVTQQCLTLTLAHEGEGSAPVASPANSPGCPAGLYVAGDEILVTASPRADLVVSGWHGTRNDTNTTLTNIVAMPPINHIVTVIYGSTAPLPDTPTSTPTSTPTAIPTAPDGTAILYMPIVHQAPTATITPTPTATPLAPKWQRVGPGGFEIGAVARQGNTLFAADRRSFAAGGGLYRRPLAGCNLTEGWTRIENIGFSVLDVEFRGNFGVAAAFAENGIFYSADGGASWNRSTNLPGQPRTAIIAGDNAFFTGTENNGVYKSLDGAAWTEQSPTPQFITVIALSSTTIWIGADRDQSNSTRNAGVWRLGTLDGTPSQFVDGLGEGNSRRVWDFLVSTANNIYIATSNGVFWGNGITWTPDGLQGTELRSLETAPNYFYAGAFDEENRGTVAGVWRRPLNGGAWEQVNSPGWDSTYTVRDLLYEPTYCNGLLAATDDGVWLYR